MKTAARAFALLIILLLTDRTARASGVASGISLATGRGLTLAEAHQWIAFYATCVGALGATATLVYVVLRIARMLRNPSATE